jgi:AAA domain
MRPATADLQRLDAAALEQPGALRRQHGIKFQCPACAAEGHDKHQDNACLFSNGDWGCAWSKDTDLGRAHWEAIGRALGAFHTNGHTRSFEPPAPGATRTSGLDSVWASAIAVPVFLEEADEVVGFLEPRLLVRGGITELYSPRGLGKTQVAYAIAVRLARTGLRVLLVDRDNPRHEIRRRLKKWGGHDASHFKLITRDKAPALTDALAWSAFPLNTFDVVIIDSIDASTEGVGEGDSAKPSVAFAAVLDLARRADGPAILVLGNVVKSGAHSRGSGVLEDRGDVVYEIRDATDLKPSGQKDWWHELAPAGVGDGAARASRRKRRDVYRLAFIPTKFRLGEEPEPFVLEIDHRAEPWTLRDVTADLVEAGHHALTSAISERQAQVAQATHHLLAEMRHRADYGKPPLTKGEAEELVYAAGLKRAAARGLVGEGAGRLWQLSRAPRQGGKGGTAVFVVFLSRDIL